MQIYIWFGTLNQNKSGGQLYLPWFSNLSNATMQTLCIAGKLYWEHCSHDLISPPDFEKRQRPCFAWTPSKIFHPRTHKCANMIWTVVDWIRRSTHLRPVLLHCVSRQDMTPTDTEITRELYCIFILILTTILDFASK